MELNKLVFGVLAFGCLGAAAAGGYLAARPDGEAGPQAPITSAAPEASPVPAEQPAPTGRAPVAESEGVIAPDPATTVTPAPARPAAEPLLERPTSTPRRESAPRSAP